MTAVARTGHWVACRLIDRCAFSTGHSAGIVPMRRLLASRRVSTTVLKPNGLAVPTRETRAPLRIFESSISLPKCSHSCLILPCMLAMSAEVSHFLGLCGRPDEPYEPQLDPHA